MISDESLWHWRPKEWLLKIQLSFSHFKVYIIRIENCIYILYGKKNHNISVFLNFLLNKSSIRDFFKKHKKIITDPKQYFYCFCDVTLPYKLPWLKIFIQHQN